MIGEIVRLFAQVRSRRAETTNTHQLDPRLARFARGLTLGAIVGAAIAGSTIWRRLTVEADEPAVEPGNRPPADRG